MKKSKNGYEIDNQIDRLINKEREREREREEREKMREREEER